MTQEGEPSHTGEKKKSRAGYGCRVVGEAGRKILERGQYLFFVSPVTVRYVSVCTVLTIHRCRA
jgi:hypothetical protein